MSYERKLGRVVDSVREAKGRRSCTLLIGAGCSVTAGIPAASGFVEEIEKRYGSAYEAASRKTYPYCMGELGPAERRALIAEFVETASLNWAHIAIAVLVKERYVDRVLTTNFDPLVLRACALLGHIPAVYDCAASESIISLKDVDGPAVFHLHGQHTGPILINTEEQMEDNAKKIEPVFEPSRENRTWIVVGYSGENDPVFNHLAKIKCFDSCLYWVCHEDEPVPEHVAQRLLTENRYAYSVHGYDADGFFVRLAQELRVFPPDLLQRPFSHLHECLEPLPTQCRLPGQEEPIEFGANCRKWIEQGIAIFEEGKLDVLDSVRTHLASERVAAQAEKLLLARKYEELATMHQAQTEPIAERLKLMFAFGYVLWGTALQDRAQTAEGDEAERLLSDACQKYDAAMNVKADFHEGLRAWALALRQQAMRKEGKQADELFEQAYEKYTAAVALKPDSHEALDGWGSALCDHATTKEGKQADELFEQAYEKYTAAVALKPDYHEALGRWGVALHAQARKKESQEADELFEQAYGKHAAALALRPDFHEALDNWGFALHDQARRKTGEEADRLFQQAYDKFTAALKIKPGSHSVLSAWGLALHHQANSKEGEEADRLFEQAYGKYAAAVKVKPDDHVSLCNWGNALSNHTMTKESEEADQLFERAYEKHAAAVKLKPDDHVALFSYGLALGRQASMKEGQQADGLFAQAYGKYEAALAIKPDFHLALYSWGLALYEQAKTKEGEEAERLFGEACAKFKAAVKIKPDLHEALNNWAGALLQQGGLKEGDEGRASFCEAKEKALEVEQIKPGAGAYNAACACARLDEEEECRKWLETALEHGTLERRSHMEQDKDLDSVRDQEWFKEILGKAPEG